MLRCTRIRFIITCFLALASWSIAADPVTTIQSPLMNRPAIVRPGDEFEIEFTGSGTMTARLQTAYFSQPLEVTTVPYDLAGLRHAKVRVNATHG